MLCSHKTWSTHQQRFRHCKQRASLSDTTLCPHHLKEYLRRLNDNNDDPNSRSTGLADQPSHQTSAINPKFYITASLLQKLLEVSSSLNLVDIPTSVAPDPSFSSIYPPPISVKKYKHLLQESSIIKNVLSRDLIPHQSLCRVVEFGAGIGNLSHHLQLAHGHSRSCLCAKNDPSILSPSVTAADKLQSPSNLEFVLIDRLSFRSRRSKDYLIRNGGSRVIRLTNDLSSISPFEILPFESSESSLLFISKHFCGPATDLALSHIARASPHADSKSISLCLSTCCHHLLSLESYINTPYISQLGFSTDEINLIFKLTSWATLDLGFSSSDCSDVVASGLKSLQTDPKWRNLNLQELTENLKRTEKVALGHVAKRLLDHGRIMYIRNTFKHKDKAPDVQLVKYTDRSCEDRIIVGTLG
ncbi:methyltransferase TRM13-domain-containing protein [Paraphysoderma sedebokerense]|nr:methyltransferase TRM13-domain-containing protein [Paraphysoderma sedebokerense]